MTVRSPLPPEDVERRINEEAGSRWNPFQSGVVGGALAGRIRLRVRRFFRNDWKPILAGRISSEGGGSRIELAYRAPRWALPFALLWFAIVILMSVTMVAQGMGSEDAWIAAIILPAFYLIPVLAYILGTWGAETECELLLHFIARVTDAQIENRPRSRRGSGSKGPWSQGRIGS